MEIVVNINPTAALLVGASAAGRQIVTFDASALTLEDRELLAKNTEPERGGPYDREITGRLVLRGSAIAPTIDAVLAACRARAEQAAAEKAEEKERNEKRVQEFLAMPAEDWIKDSWGSPFLWSPEIPLCNDPRIVARREEIERTVWAAVAAKHAEEKRAREAEAAAFEAKQKAAEEARDAAARQLASGYSGLARAAAEGYPVLGAVLTALKDSVQRRIETDVSGARFTDLAYAPEERHAPTPEVLALRAVCVKACEAVEVPEVLGRWEVSRVVRVDVAPQGSERWITGVIVRLLDHAGREEREFVATLEDPEVRDEE